MKSYAKLIFMATFAVLLLTTFAAADTPGAHPAYLHALTDLRHARAHLNVETPNARVDAAEAHAIDEIDAAIREVRGGRYRRWQALERSPSGGCPLGPTGTPAARHGTAGQGARRYRPA